MNAEEIKRANALLAVLEPQWGRPGSALTWSMMGPEPKCLNFHVHDLSLSVQPALSVRMVLSAMVGRRQLLDETLAQVRGHITFQLGAVLLMKVREVLAQDRFETWPVKDIGSAAQGIRMTHLAPRQVALDPTDTVARAHAGYGVQVRVPTTEIWITPAGVLSIKNTADLILKAWGQK